MIDITDYINDNNFNLIPFIKIPISNSDLYVEYTQFDRLDKISNDNYSTPLYSKLILMANPSFKKESDITPGSVIRVPFPLDSARQRVINSIELLKKF